MCFNMVPPRDLQRRFGDTTVYTLSYAGTPELLDRVSDGTLLDEIVSGRVNDDRRSFHQAQFPLSNHAGGFRTDPHMERNKITFREQLVEG